MLSALSARDTFAQLKAVLSRVRKWLIVVALLLSVIVVALEAGSPLIAPAAAPSAAGGVDWQALQAAGGDVLPAEVLALIGGENSVTDQLSPPTEALPGWGVRALAFVDAILLFTIALIVASHFVKASVIAKTQGIITLIFAILLLLAVVLFLLLVVVQLIAMIALLLAIPFGTLVYLVMYGWFDRGAAAALLTWLFGLKLLFGVCLVLTNERYLQNVGLVLAVLTMLVANIIVSFLHGIVPIILVSITDAIAALVVAILAIIWAVVLLIGSIVSILAVLRSPLSWVR